MNFRKAISAAVGVGVTAGTALVLLTATPAAASSTCTTWRSSNGGTAYGKCTGGNTRFSQHRVWAVCVGPNGHTFNLEGNWVNTRKGQTSHATCSSDPGHSGVAVLKMKIETDEPL
ncbi:hypothetical protein ACF1A5_02055 [Streptomyces sp. NPDC014864]|uniref:hypothetical protein n=1 Tax=Streptomyces sp. NPDC014864 TaxID=3364924 RepID=UPI0036F6B1CA